MPEVMSRRRLFGFLAVAALAFAAPAVISDEAEAQMERRHRRRVGRRMARRVRRLGRYGARATRRAVRRGAM
jgi:hypothetical protein